MKIAMIGHKRVPSREGGVEIHVEEIAVRLAKQGHDVTLYNRKRKGYPHLKNYHGVKIVTVPTINVKSLDAVIYSFFATIHSLFKNYDIIHYHAEGPCSMLWIPALLGIRTVATIHGLDWQRAKWGSFATKFLKFGEKVAAKFADQVIVLSKNVKQYFEETYCRETKFVPNGVNVPTIRSANIIEKKYSLSKNDYILFLARIVPEKGLHYLLEAFEKIDTNKKLVIAGASSHTNDYVENIKAMAKKDSRVIMTGFVQGEELDELFSNTMLYVLPSDIEGMPISLLEALSYGCPCLVSNIPENMEVMGPSGFCFMKSDSNDLIEQLNRFLTNQVSPEKTCSSFQLEKFNWDSVIKTLLNDCYQNGKVK